jgi:hypothetical protein
MYTHHQVLFIRILCLVLLLLLSGPDVFNLAHTLATSSSVWSMSLSGGEVIASAHFVAASASELQLGRTSTFVADQFLEYFVVTQFSASFHPVYGIVLTVFGEGGEGLEAQTSLRQTLEDVSMYRGMGLDGRTLEAKSERFCSPGAGSESFCRQDPCCRAMARIWLSFVNHTKRTHVEVGMSGGDGYSVQGGS